jgi:L-ascorbate metabolism protein UlaG (beta-lactamase superfamily)
MSTDYAAPDLVRRISAEQPPAGALALWWLGQASFALVGAGIVLYIDPYLALSDRRLSPPPFAPEAVTNADLVLLTHDHTDHVDPRSLPGIAAASPKARFVAPRPILERVAALVGGSDRVIPAAADETLALDLGGARVEVRPVPAKHEEFDRVEAGYPYLGYSIRLAGVCVHHSGDTIPYEGQVDRVTAHGVDVALLPINGRDFYRTRSKILGNFDYREAGEFATQIHASVVIPIHYGMFRGNTVPPGHFVSHLHDFHPEQSIHVMGRFGKYVYVRDRG